MPGRFAIGQGSGKGSAGYCAAGVLLSTSVTHSDLVPVGATSGGPQGMCTWCLHLGVSGHPYFCGVRSPMPSVGLACGVTRCHLLHTLWSAHHVGGPGSRRRTGQRASSLEGMSKQALLCFHTARHLAWADALSRSGLGGGACPGGAALPCAFTWLGGRAWL